MIKCQTSRTRKQVCTGSTSALGTLLFLGLSLLLVSLSASMPGLFGPDITSSLPPLRAIEKAYDSTGQRSINNVRTYPCFRSGRELTKGKCADDTKEGY